MKKNMLAVLIFVLAVFAASFSYGAAGSCVQSDVAYTWADGTRSFKTLTFTCTFGTGGDVATALTSATTTANTTALTGWYLLMGTTLNGATAPTALYDLYLKETVGAVADAVDILGTGGLNRPGTASTSSQFTPITDTTYASAGLRPILNTLTLTASGNAVESGAFTAQFIFVK